MDEKTLKAEFAKKMYGFKLANELRVRELKARTHEYWLTTLPYVHMVRDSGGYLFQEAADLQRGLKKHGISFCFIGGVALQMWGEVRQTSDIDLNIYCELGEEDNVLKTLECYLTPRGEDTRENFSTSRVFFGRTANGFEVDVFVGFTPFEKRMTERAIEQDYGLDNPLRICSAEDLAVTKTIAGRGQDWVDLQRIIQRSGATMNWTQVYTELDSLLVLYHAEDRMLRLKGMVAEEYPS